jgi:hypothetical protein
MNAPPQCQRVQPSLNAGSGYGSGRRPAPRLLAIALHQLATSESAWKNDRLCTAQVGLLPRHPPFAGAEQKILPALEDRQDHDRNNGVAA